MGAERDGTDQHGTDPHRTSQASLGQDGRGWRGEGQPFPEQWIEDERNAQQRDAGEDGAYRWQRERAADSPREFWADAAGAVTWTRQPRRILDDDHPPFYRWFPDAELNTCANALDRHVEGGRGDEVALVYDSPVTGTIRRYTFAELTDEVARAAGALAALGVGRGDRVIIYLPMIPAAVISMLACARLGAVHSVVFGGFAAAELAARMDDARATVVVSASCGIEPSRIVPYKPMLDEAIGLARHPPTATLVVQRDQRRCTMIHGRDHDWDAALAGATPHPPVPVAATDPLYILYTSGTTGRPKGIVRDNGGHAVAMTWSMGNVYGIRAGDVMWAASDVGWAVGHSYTVYAPLLAGATTVLYEGKPVGTPDAGAFWRVVAEHGVNVLFTAPTAIRGIRREDPTGALPSRYDLSSLRALFLAGERLDPPTYEWAAATLGIPVIDNYWQTETGWPIASSPLGLEPLPVKAGSPSVPMPGYDVQVLDPAGAPVPAGVEGALCLRLPLPPGTLPTLWGDDERYVASYLSAYDGHYLTGDGGYLDEDGYLFVLGRTDDVINVAGHRLSTGSMEAVLAEHPAVAECAVVGVADPLKGQVPRGLVVVKSGVGIAADALAAELVARVRERIGPVAAFRRVDVVTALPKTRSGKILRRTMREIADGRTPAVPPTIEDPTVLDALRPVLTSP
ncbi:propionyl-CoA synthetase [Frankia sp. AiPs1]|uniref:AMP-binding protein n=1 Tax=Frankia sp. AiPa1 TaxID=573492 RepID=UPI00202AF148|nr:AMP-binding protein [Frankia sp. AiPa1]MCL9758229.1 AMP-binding protein [Frankia sp. AiPa1]